MTRRGTTMVELLVAGVLLVALTAVCVQMLAVLAGHRRAVEQEQTAIREAANLMERLAAVPWDELTPEGVRDVRLSEEARRALPGGELEISVTSSKFGEPLAGERVAGDRVAGVERSEPPVAQVPGAKRILVSIRWQDRTGRFVRPVRLAAWRYGGI